MTPKILADTVYVTSMAVVVLPMLTWIVLRVPFQLSFAELFRWAGGYFEEHQKWVRRIYFLIFSVPVIVLALSTTLNRTSEAADPDPNKLRVYFALVHLVTILAVVAMYIPGVKARLVVMGLTMPFLGTWVLFPNWLTADLLGLTMAALIAVAAKPTIVPFVYVWAATMIYALAYDTVQVFITGNMQATVGPMIEANLALLVLIPAQFSLNAPLESGLGLGDIIAVLILLVSAAAIARRTGRRSIYLAGLVGYVLGHVGTITAGKMTGHWQPASLYIVVSMGMCVMAVTLITNNRRELMRRDEVPTHSPTDPVTP